MPAKIIIVDNQDNPIGLKEQGTLDFDKDIWRASALWITNSKNQILLAKRSFTKKQNPGLWGPAVAGTIEENETYDSNIIKEAKEELGLKDIKPKKGIKTNTIGKQKYQHFIQWYFLELDRKIKDFEINKKEVAEIRWFLKENLVKTVKEGDDGFSKSIEEYIKEFLKSN